MTCLTCGADAPGRFCSSCGAATLPPTCSQCGAPGPVDARFCIECGGPVLQTPAPSAFAGSAGAGAPATAGGAQPVFWWIGGLLLVGLIVFVAYPVVTSTKERPAAAASSGLGPAGNVDLSTMTPREAADRLFDRVMRGVEARDTMEIINFLPMAIAAYDMARPLDADGHWHLSLLHRAGLDFPEALAEARKALEDHPNHILNLSAAAEASAEMGDTTTARGYFTRLLEAYPTEAVRDLEEYQIHGGVLPQMRMEAQDFLEATASR